MPFEHAVRPFQTPDSFGRAIIPAVPSARARATLTWGAKTTVSDVVPQRTGINVECCKDNRQQYESDTVIHNSFINQVWGPGTPGPSQPHGQWGAEIFHLRSANVRLRKKEEDTCSSDLDQISGVASGIKEAFADLKADIEAGGAGKTVDSCKAKMKLYSYGGTPFHDDVLGSFPYKNNVPLPETKLSNYVQYTNEPQGA